MQSKLIGLVLFITTAVVQAQQTPTAGNQLQQIPASPQESRREPEMRVEKAGNPDPASDSAPDAARITVSRLQVTGQRAFSESQLLAVSGFRPGSAMTLAQLRAMANNIADFYHEQGFFLARAYLPAQDVKGGVVTIAVLEGQYGKVTLRNSSAVDDSVAQGLLAGLNRGDAVLIGPLETRLLLLSDLPGVEVKSTLVPGAALGSTDLVLDVTPGPRIHGSVDADNHGNRYTGKGRIGATVNFNELAGHGDVLTLRAMTSAKGLDYGRLAYQLQAGRASLGVAYTRMDYELGNDFALLEAHGTAAIASVFASYPLIRSRRASVHVRMNADAKTLRDRQDAAQVASDKKTRVVSATLGGDVSERDGASNRFALTWSAGRLDLGSAAARAADAASARTGGRYYKVGYSWSRLQHVAPGLALYGALAGQTSSKNLDASEKMGLGGAGAVRAFPEGEAYADSATVLTLEIKKMMGASRLPGQLQLIGFIDAGTATLDKSPWSAGRRNRSVSGAGIGLEWRGDHAVVAKAYVAHKLGREKPTSAPDQRYRLLVEAVKYF